jgi:hypothetical protein
MLSTVNALNHYRFQVTQKLKVLAFLKVNALKNQRFKICEQLTL